MVRWSGVAIYRSVCMSSLERAVQLANPLTGEVLTLASPDEDLVKLLDDLKEYGSVIQEHRRMVGRELIARLDRQAKWTAYAGDFKFSSASPAPSEEWDGIELRTALLGFVDAGKLSIQALDAAIETVVTYKVRKQGVNALRKLGGRIAEVVDELAMRIERGERSVRVERI